MDFTYMGKTKDLSKSTRPKPKKMTAKEQSEQFVKAARILQMDETGVLFDAEFDRIIPTVYPCKGQ